jgi:acyl carrier protein
MTVHPSVVVGVIREVCPPGTPEIADFDRPLADYGLDSLDLSAIFLALEERYGIKISDEDFDRLNTVNRIVVFLDRATTGAAD